jgi:exodeoxyribonuclease-3
MIAANDVVVQKITNLKVVSWNVNGIRSRIFTDKIASQLKKNTLIEIQEKSPIDILIRNHNPDIICLQETRCSIAISENFKIPGYKSYFNESKSSGARAPERYSGTCIFYKEYLVLKEIHEQIPGYEDTEGRIIVSHFEDFILINVYAPNSGSNYDKKIIFIEAMLDYLKSLDCKVIFCGDLNIAVSTHFDIKTTIAMPGIYPHELEFYDRLLEINYKDCIDNDEIVFTWWDTRREKENGMSIARNRNLGWRLDYFFTKNFNQVSSKCLKYIGENNESIPLASDHAPVLLNTTF